VCLDDLRLRLEQLVQAKSRNYVRQNVRDEGGRHHIAGSIQYVLADSLTISTETAPCTYPDVLESFQTAKARVITGFERDYIIRMLRHHSGNISMAARAAQKHRRAFWALMRKHQIDAELYRDAATASKSDAVAAVARHQLPA